MIEIICAFAAGWILGRIFLLRRINHEYDEQEEFERQSFEELQILVNIEKHGDILYAYAKDDGEFVAQGIDANELTESFMLKKPGHLMVCSYSDANKYGLLGSKKDEPNTL